LVDAGYPDGFGIALHCTNDRYVNDAKVCQALGQMFARTGLKVDVQTMPRSVFFPKATDHAGERFSFLLLGWGNATSGDAGTLPSVIHTLDKPRALGTWNIGHYTNPAFDKIIDDAVATMDLKKRHTLFAEAMVVAMQDYAVIPLYFQSVVVGLRKGWSYKTWASERTIADSVDRPN
jgi:peptide/nickel transport system substrate-binding protein